MGLVQSNVEDITFALDSRMITFIVMARMMVVCLIPTIAKEILTATNTLLRVQSILMFQKNIHARLPLVIFKKMRANANQVLSIHHWLPGHY